MSKPRSREFGRWQNVVSHDSRNTAPIHISCAKVSSTLKYDIGIAVADDDCVTSGSPKESFKNTIAEESRRKPLEKEENVTCYRRRALVSLWGADVMKFRTSSKVLWFGRGGGWGGRGGYVLILDDTAATGLLESTPYIHSTLKSCEGA